MIGNQAMINAQLIEHQDNPVKEPIGDKEVADIIYMITDEYWKEWRRKLTNGDTPHIYAPGLGSFDMMYGKSKTYLRHLLARIRNIKRKYPDTYLTEGTRANGLYTNTIKRFRSTWKQVDNLKKEVNKKYKIWNDKKIAKYGDKAIL